ncbi:hypothetical protein EUX98_g4651 [Antrodiella citrinella]|uniref:Pseudouridine synthase RsuA/RluA-like domain-containing protein n=1 Tax=Antrodiella citrinella TaxID=2447956 RepID=A0A4V3XIK0_9APHY|nr:hypothetical protein EUX98_g4651 [Antrodiella citrinella]
MILQYLFAAISAFIPLLTIFRQSAFVDWTKGLASSFTPTFLSPTCRDLLLPEGTVAPLDIAQGIDLSLAAPIISSVPGDLDVHPAFHTILSLWSALVPVTDIYHSTLRVYLPIFLMCIVSCLGAFLLISALKSAPGKPAADASAVSCDAMSSLELIDQLGQTVTDGSLSEAQRELDLSLALSPSVSGVPLNSSVSVASRMIAAQNNDLPAADDTPYVNAFPDTFAVRHAIEDVRKSGTQKVAGDDDDESLCEYDLLEHPVSPNDFCTWDAPDFSPALDNDLVVPVVDYSDAADATQVPLPPSPLLLPNPSSMDLATLQEVTLLDSDILDLKEENLLDVQLSEIDLVELSQSNDTLVSCYSDHIASIDSEMLTLDPDEPALPSSTVDWNPSSDSFCVLFETLGSPELIGELEFREDVTPFAPVDDSTELVPLVTLSTDAAQFRFKESDSSPFPLDTPVPATSSQDYRPLVISLGNSAMDELISAFRSALGSHSSTSSMSNCDVAPIGSPCSDDSNQGRASIDFRPPFPLMEPDEPVQHALGENIDARDWTIVNVRLNEDGKYIFVPTSYGPTAVQESPDADTVIPSTISADDQQADRRHAPRHARSGSEDLRRQPGTALIPIRPRSASGQSSDLQLLSMRLGLINHQRDYHMFEPIAELRFAIQGERAALAGANIPRMRRLGQRRLNYGLTQAEFLGLLANAQPYTAGYSYAERLRHNLPQIRSCTYTAPPVRAIETAPAASTSSVPMVVQVNKNRGGQDAHVEAINQIDIDRQRAKAASERPARRRTSSGPDSMMRRSRRASTAATTSVTAQSAFAGASADSGRDRTSDPSDMTRHEDVISSGSQPGLRKTKSCVNVGDRTNQATRVKEPSAPAHERNHRRASSGSPSLQSKSSYSTARSTHIRQSRRSSVSQAPPLETIAGSPPDSPKAKNARPAYPSLDAMMAEAVPSFISSDQPLASAESNKSTASPSSSRFGGLLESKPKPFYPRIDDDGAMDEVPMKFDWPNSLRATSRRKIPPYWYAYTTMAKGRWLGRKILEVVSSEFRDRSMDFYRYALESGVTTINGVVAQPDTIVRNGDRIENVVHRHEPPVTDKPVKLLLHDPEREFIVVEKPGSIPVHAAGRYFKNTLVEILQNDFGFRKVYTVNRLDRLTSGLMILPTSSVRANELTQEFFNGTISKEYVARCNGRFPEHEVICEEPMLTIDRQMGLNIVHPDGKPAKTIFNLIRYDPNTDTSVVRCKPLTGRSHQIRVHLQYLGHSIANDPVYSEKKIWGENLGKGGLDFTTSTDERSAPQAPPQFQFTSGDNPESLPTRTPITPSLEAREENNNLNGTGSASATAGSEKPTLLPRETGHDIGLASPVPLSAEAVKVITGLRNMKDEDEDWSRWRDVVFRAKSALTPKIKVSPLPPQNQRKRGGGGPVKLAKNAKLEEEETLSSEPIDNLRPVPEESRDEDTENTEIIEIAQSANQLTSEEVLEKLKVVDGLLAKEAVETEATTDDMHYCPECYLPIHPDPKPERLYIFLHALRYTTSLGSFETEMPEWAAEGWEWDRS